MTLSVPALEVLSQRLASYSESGGLDALRGRDQRRRQGAYFTPQPLVEFVVDQALEAFWAGREVQWDPKGYPRLRILDPSAGDGRFLLAAARWLLRRGGARACEQAIMRHCMIAIERDPNYAQVLAERLGASTNVHCREALLSGIVGDGSVDVVLGNPPYLRSIHLGESDASLQSDLRGVYAATSHGEWDLYAAFLEQGLAWLRPGGELALVVPSRWWSARWAGPLRQQLADAASVRALVDFGAEQIFANATVYASLCFASAQPHDHIELARRASSEGWQLGAVATAELGAAPWPLAVGASRALVQTLTAAGPRLGDLAQICKGAGTNADSVFVITDTNTEIEPALLRPVLRGRDVTAFAEARPWPRVLVPYDEDCQLIAPARMRSEFPRAYAYLAQHRDTLEAREKGRFAGPQFYCFGRPQNMRFHGSDAAKVVVPDVTKAGRAMVDRQASLVLDSAYALRPVADAALDLESLCGILNSRVVALWLAQQGMTLRGGYTRMKTLFLRELPIPAAGPRRSAIGDAVRANRGIAEIDELVRVAYGVELAVWNQ